MSHSLAVLGVPSSAGAHFPGLEQGPEHFRGAGLLARLLCDGFDVVDLGDLPTVTWEPDPVTDRPRSVQNVTEVARQVAQSTATTHSHRLRSLVIGGDCSITAGVISGLSQEQNRVGVVYLDGHVDLNTLESSDYGVLDSMVMTHVLGIYDNEYSRLGPSFPLLNDEQVLFAGYDSDGLNDGEIPLLTARQTLNVSRADVTSSPETVSAMLRKLEERVDTIVVHFDVDVINFIEFPVANFPWYDGLTLEQVGYCLEQFLSSPKFGHLVLTEFNPDRDRSRDYARQLIDVIAGKLKLGSESWREANVPRETGVQ